MRISRFWFLPTSANFNSLDVGSGTGLWIIRVQDNFESCKVKGIDLSLPHWDITICFECSLHITNKIQNFASSEYNTIDY